MLIDFSSIIETVKHNVRGGEKSVGMRAFEDGDIKFIIIKLEPGASIGYHQHVDNCELFYGVEGKGKVIVEDGEEKIEPGLCHYCPMGKHHSLVNDSDADLVVFAVIPKYKK